MQGYSWQALLPKRGVRRQDIEREVAVMRAAWLYTVHVWWNARSAREHLVFFPSAAVLTCRVLAVVVCCFLSLFDCLPGVHRLPVCLSMYPSDCLCLCLPGRNSCTSAASFCCLLAVCLFVCLFLCVLVCVSCLRLRVRGVGSACVSADS